MIFARSLLFNLFFYLSTFLLVFPATAVRLAAPAKVLEFAKFWAGLQMAAARVLCGIRLEIHGQENLPAGPALIAAQIGRAHV